MEQFLERFFWRRFHVKGVYEARKAGLPAMIGQTFLTSSLLACPILLKVAEAGRIAEGEEMVMLLYPAILMLNFLFLLFLSLMSLLLNYTAAERLRLREFYSLYAYSGTFPTLVACVTGVLAGVAFVYLIYNFGMIFWAYLIYRRGQKGAAIHLKFSNQ